MFVLACINLFLLMFTYVLNIRQRKEFDTQHRKEEERFKEEEKQWKREGKKARRVEQYKIKKAMEKAEKEV